MGLNHPSDLGAWREWQLRHQPMLRRLRHAGARPPRPELVIIRRSDEPTVLIAMDSSTPTSVSAFTTPLARMAHGDAAIVALGDVRQHLPEPEAWKLVPIGTDPRVPTCLRSVGVVFGIGHYLPASAVAFSWAERLGIPFAVAQHGLMTPFAPPLPPSAHLLAFSDEDAAFWASGRPDVTHEVVGSQLLWDAAKRRPAGDDGEPANVTDRDATPIFLGQLHGAELARGVSAKTAGRFCARTGASYRPHPAETDKLSRAQHAAWKARGIDVDRSGSPLRDNRRPVVSIFSTGVLEAAAAGVDSWVTGVDVPEWVRDFWRRYDLSEWGSEPTPAPRQPDVEPATAIARSLDRLIEGAAR